MKKYIPKYPIYVISKGRFENCLTAKFLIKDEVPFHLVVEQQEYEEYKNRLGKEYIYTLPFSNLGLGSIPARNWVWQHSIKQGHSRHWIFDDNIREIYRRWHEKRIRCDSGYALKITETFIDRYENIAIAGLNYDMNIVSGKKLPPFRLNNHVYSCLLVKNDIPYRWRGRYNEDTDLCLQVLSGGLCTILMNIFSIDKVASMKMKGGNTDVLYKGDGRLKMARSLERMWPGVISVGRRYGRPQHIVKYTWRRFDTPLKRKKEIDFNILPKINEFDIDLKQIDEIKSEELTTVYKQWHNVNKTDVKDAD